MKPGRQEFTVEGACIECMHLGWFPFNDDSEVQRCDVCRVFATDDEAFARALQCAVEALKKPRRRSGKRFHHIVEAIEIAAWQVNKSPDPDVQGTEATP